ncbi:MAG: zinc ribbon domain-containing protein [Desulfobacterales bacterium]
MEFNFCPYCGKPLEETSIGKKTRPFCEHCQWVSYRNPTVGVAVILLEKKELLLVRRIGSYADQ